MEGTMTRLAFVAPMLLIICSAAMAQTDGTGAGIILGEPTGFCIKHWMGSSSALDAAIAWSFEDDGALHIHADYLLHAFGVFEGDSERIGLYYGIGGRIRFGEEGKENVIGVRVPFGALYPFEGAPVDIFLELVPIMDMAPDTEFGLSGAIGVRYFF